MSSKIQQLNRCRMMMLLLSRLRSRSTLSRAPKENHYDVKKQNQSGLSDSAERTMNLRKKVSLNIINVSSSNFDLGFDNLMFK